MGALRVLALALTAARYPEPDVLHGRLGVEGPATLTARALALAVLAHWQGDPVVVAVLGLGVQLLGRGVHARELRLGAEVLGEGVLVGARVHARRHSGAQRVRGWLGDGRRWRG